MAKTADRLIEGVKRRITIPANQALIDDEDILALGDDVIGGKIVPLLMSLTQDYFTYYSEIPLVANQADYDIPYRAIGRTVRDLKLSDGAGSVRDMSLVSLEDSHLFNRTGTIPQMFYLRGDKIVVVPPPPTGTTMTLQCWWLMPPSKLVKTDQAGLVTAMTATTVTVAMTPDWLVAGSTIDFVQGKSGNSILDFDITATSVAGTTITFASGDVPTTLALGDYIAQAEYSPVIMLPNECYSYLETATSRRVLQAIGDLEGYQAMGEDDKEQEKALKTMLEPRVQGESVKIINRRSLLRGWRGGYRGGYFT